jgi:hypothetical protein
MARTITRLFDGFAAAQNAVVDLKRIGIPEGDISLVSNQSDEGHRGVRVREPHDHTADEAAARDAGVGATAGGALGAAAGLLAGLGLLAIPGLGPVVAAGWLASAATGAVVGGAVGGAGGGLVGALTNAGVSKEEAHVYAEGVRRGGTLVSAKIADDKLAAAESALKTLPSVDVASRGAAYRQEGWRQFDETAPAYTEGEITRERTRYGAG